MTSINNCLEELRLTKDQEQKYRILIELSRQKIEFPTKQKTKANLIPNCTVRIWNYQGEFWSDSRLINALLIIVEKDKSKDIKKLLQYYDIKDFYSTLRIDTLLLLNFSPK